MVSRLVVVSVLSCLAMAGCASKPPSQLSDPKTAYAPVTEGEDAASGALFDKFGKPKGAKSFGPLAGRTLSVGSISEIALADKEVILTFDDGPIPARTNKILDILQNHGVKATFLMVGQMADSYPGTAARVVREGHSIGGHTHGHANLAGLGHERALAEIASGNSAVRRATGTTVGFFRFPYLADTAALRRDVANRGLVILDADIDSKDYFTLSPATLAERTMAKVRKRRKGIILMHDIHNRTAAMLPMLLSQLKAEGYKVVTLRYRGSPLPDAMVSARSVKPATNAI